MPALEHGREVAAGDRADRRAAGARPRPVAGRLAALGHQARAGAGAGPSARSASSAARPRNSLLVPADDPPQAGLERGDARAQLVAVQGQAGLEAQGVAGPEAGRGDPGREHGLPERRGQLGRHGALDPVLAGVAGPGRGQGVPVPLEGGHARSGRTAAASGATAASRDRASGPGRRPRPARRWRPAPAQGSSTRAVFEALGMTSKRSPSTHHTMMSSATEPSLGRAGGCTGPGPGRSCRRSLVSAAWRRSKAPGPSTRTVPRWLTSKATAPVPAGPVLGHGARRVGEGHLPAAELHHLGRGARAGDERGTAEVDGGRLSG